MTIGGPPRADVEVVPTGPLQGRVAAPASKSITNRLLVVSALADGVSVLRAPLDSDDSAAMRGVMEALGARMSLDSDEWRIEGTGGRLAAPAEPLDAGLSGTTMRFGTAVAALASGPVTLTGQPPLLQRPVGALSSALRALGSDVVDDHGHPPVRTPGGGLRGGAVTVDVSGSSQFASAVMLAAPYAAADVEMAVTGGGAWDYIRLTADVLHEWGAHVAERDGGGWSIAAGGGYEARDVTVEYDASAAAHLLALAAATGGTVTVTNAAPVTHQPDADLPAVLEQFGCAVRRAGMALTVQGPEHLRPVEVDLECMPDQVTTVACLAALADGASEIRGVGVARTHETDRLAALAAELSRLDVTVTERPDGLRIVGGAARGPARLPTYDDHRLAMAFAALAARVPGVTIAEPWCVTKTYPRFWEDVRRLGLSWTEVDESPRTGAGPSRDAAGGTATRGDGHGANAGRRVGVVVAIDGPGGAGKSTIARALADRLRLTHVDTGAIYRAAALAVLRAGADPADEDACAEIAGRVRIECVGDRTLLEGEDVEEEIRGPWVTAYVSQISGHPAVRAALLPAQRAAVAEGGAVVEGRDAGTAVVPAADLKVWLTATPEERAGRRAAQLGEEDPVKVAALAQALASRDASDAERMLPADDAVVVDTSGKSVAEIIDVLLEALGAGAAS